MALKLLRMMNLPICTKMSKSGNSIAAFDDYLVLAYGVEQGNGLKIVTVKEQVTPMVLLFQKEKMQNFCKCSIQA